MSREFDTSIGGRVRAARLAKKLTQVQLSKLANVPQAAVSEVESGKHGPGIAFLAAVSRALDVTTDYLLGLTDDPKQIATTYPAEAAKLLPRLDTTTYPIEDARLYADFVAASFGRDLVEVRDLLRSLLTLDSEGRLDQVVKAKRRKSGGGAA